ncbi:unnamed protein product [Owenia fusiformis]|uniref:Uncharacterized protein n=1 Tax=Owenia fusiformis TaxID=6347 RepID=A0A8J1U104_OWEFU|nr:unnamed protein product [Owenia fusiformis]
MTSYILRISRITRIERFCSSHSSNFGRGTLLKVDFDQSCHFSKKFYFRFHPGSSKHKDSRFAHSPVIMAGVLTTIWDKLRGHRAAATYSGPSPQVLAEQERIAKMPIEEKRKHYRCREHYKVLKDVPTWNEYFHKNITEKTNKGPKSEVSSALNDKVSIWQGDITQLEIDCIANAANSSLLGGGGVDGAIHAAAGSWLYKECKELNGCDTGDAKLTSGYNLPAKYVVHTVGPIGEKPNELKACYDNCLAFMKESENGQNIASLALPCISTGVYGYPNLNAAEIAISKVRKFLEEHGEKVDRVIFCLFLNKDVAIYERLMQIYFPVAEREHPVTDPGGDPQAVNEGETEESRKPEETTDQAVKASKPVPKAEIEKVDESKESQNRDKNSQENNVPNEQDSQETPVAQTLEMSDESMSQDTDTQNTDTQDNEDKPQDMETHELARSETVEMLSQEEKDVKDNTDNIGNTGNMDSKVDSKAAGDMENVNNSPIVSPEKKRRSSDENAQEQDSKL